MLRGIIIVLMYSEKNLLIRSYDEVKTNKIDPMNDYLQILLRKIIGVMIFSMIIINVSAQGYTKYAGEVIGPKLP